jgi:hypothetical protein
MKLFARQNSSTSSLRLKTFAREFGTLYSDDSSVALLLQDQKQHEGEREGVFHSGFVCPCSVSQFPRRDGVAGRFRVHPVTNVTFTPPSIHLRQARRDETRRYGHAQSYGSSTLRSFALDNRNRPCRLVLLWKSPLTTPSAVVHLVHLHAPP